MTDASRILVVAATARELAVPSGWRSLCCGVGPVDAAVNTAAEIARERPAAVLHVGIAGARRAHALAPALAPASLVIGIESRYEDLDVPAEWAPARLLPAPALLRAVRSAFPTVAALPIGTSARVGGTGAETVPVEAMEGFAVLRAAELAGIPALEVRAISNDVEEADRSRWHFKAAFEAITGATPLLVEAVVQALREPEGRGE